VSNLSIETLIEKVESYNPEEVDNVKKAYEYANILHKGQVRQSGEPYIIHPLNVAYILAELHADGATLCAGLLHDAIEDTNVKKEDIAELFSLEVAELVEGVTKFPKINFTSKDSEICANTRKIITSVAQDIRIIIIKLADRLHNMRTLQFKSLIKQQEIATETLDIFVPLANYIGIHRIKTELEDLSLKYIYPDIYRQTELERQQLELDTKDILTDMLYKIGGILNAKNIPNEIKVRIKHVYGMYRKKEQGLSSVHDLIALKVLVNDVDNCYRALQAIHSLYHPVPGEMQDYISNPKPNKYSAFHTTLFVPEDNLIQTRIMTFEMEKIDSYGIAAHWQTNPIVAKVEMQEDLRKQYQFFESLIQIDSTYDDNAQFVQQVKAELFSKNVRVRTPRGDRVELPVGATVIDFAYKIHTEVGNTMIAAFVNDEPVALNYVLKNQDRVKIITDSLLGVPKEEWLEVVKTSKAKEMILKATRNKILR